METFFICGYCVVFCMLVVFIGMCVELLYQMNKK